jgi:hypothetical protein
MVGILTAMAAEEVVGNLVEAVSSTCNTKYELRKKHVCCMFAYFALVTKWQVFLRLRLYLS